MPSSKKKAKSKAKIKDPKAAEDQDGSEEGKEQSETSFIQSPEGGSLTPPNNLFDEDGEDSKYEFISHKLLETLECIFHEPESLQVIAEQLNSQPQMRKQPGMAEKMVLGHLAVIQDMISTNGITTKELCRVYRRFPKAPDDTARSYHPNPKDLARFKELVVMPTLGEVRKGFENRDGSSLLGQPLNTLADRRIEALVRTAVAKTDYTAAEVLHLNLEGLAYRRGITLILGDNLTHGNDEIDDYFAEAMDPGRLLRDRTPAIVGLQQLSKFELSPEFLRYPYHVPQGRPMSLAQLHAFEFLDKMFSSPLKTRESRFTLEAKDLAAQWVIIQECVRSIFQMIATVIHEEIPSASWAKTLAIQDLPVGLPLENRPDLYSFSSPAISALAREFRGLTNGIRSRGLFYSAANLVRSFGGLDELSAVTANSYVVINPSNLAQWDI